MGDRVVANINYFRKVWTIGVFKILVSLTSSHMVT